jgi:hypothetical protein
MDKRKLQIEFTLTRIHPQNSSASLKASDSEGASEGNAAGIALMVDQRRSKIFDHHLLIM